MRLLLNSLLIPALAFGLEQFLPWWSIAVAALVVNALLHLPNGKAFLSGFIGIALWWGGYAFYIDQATDSILTEKVAALLGVGAPLVMVIVTALVGGLVGGLAALTGSSFRALMAGK